MVLGKYLARVAAMTGDDWASAYALGSVLSQKDFLPLRGPIITLSQARPFAPGSTSPTRLPMV